MRISRPCYDKYHRCPGWAGGGLVAAKADRCEGGYIGYDAVAAGTWSEWKMYGCTVCDVRVLPFYIRWVDPSWYWHMGRAKTHFWLMDFKMRRRGL